jgi:hypothetical protein
MDSLPIFLNLIKSNNLICAFLLSGNLDLAKQQYHGESYYFSEKSIVLEQFSLDSTETFEYIQMTQLYDEIQTIMFVAKDSKYSDNSAYYFGEKTIYYNIMDQIKENGLGLKHEKRYCFNFLSKKASISLSGENLITLMFGEEICKNF